MYVECAPFLKRRAFFDHTLIFSVGLNFTFRMYVHNCNVLFSDQVIIFVRTVQRCIALSQLLVEQNFPAICIHRGMPQEERWVGTN